MMSFSVLASDKKQKAAALVTPGFRKDTVHVQCLKATRTRACGQDLFIALRTVALASPLATPAETAAAMSSLTAHARSSSPRETSFASQHACE